jgi:hypothetical protein
MGPISLSASAIANVQAPASDHPNCGKMRDMPVSIVDWSSADAMFGRASKRAA